MKKISIETLKQELAKLEQEAIRLSELDIEFAGISETINNNQIRKIEKTIELLQNDWKAIVPVLVDVETDEIVSKKMLMKNSAFWIVEQDGETFFIPSNLSKKKQRDYGVKIENRLTYAHVMEIDGACYHSRFEFAQDCN